MIQEIKTLSSSTHASSAPPRNVVFAVTRYFAKNIPEIEKQLAQSSLSVDDLQRATILELANPKYTNPDRDTIKSVIDLLVQSRAKITWTKDSLGDVLENLAGEVRHNCVTFANDADFSSLARSLHRPLVASLPSLLLLERRIGTNHERSPAPNLIKQTDWQALRPKEREAAELDLLGFSRDEIAAMMGISNKVVTNYLLKFRTACNRDQAAIDKTKREILTKNIARAHVVRNRLINFIFDGSELQNNSYLQFYTDKKLFRDLRRLAQHLVGRSGGFSKESYDKLKLMTAGSSIAEIALETGVRATTVSRDLARARDAIRKAFARFVVQENLPKGVNPYAWALLNDHEQQILRLFIAGKSYDEIITGLSLGIDTRKLADWIRVACGRLGLERNQLAELRDDQRLAEPDQKFLEVRLLNFVFGDNMPQSPSEAMLQADYEKLLYDQLRSFINDAELKYEQAFEMFLRGLDRGAVAVRLGDDATVLNASFYNYAQRLRRYADELITAQIEPHTKTIKLKPKQRENLILNHLYTPNTKYSFAAQGLVATDVKQVVRIATSIVNALSKEGAISPLTQQFFRGLSMADIAKFYGYPEELACEKIENDLDVVRDCVTDYLKSDLPSFIKPEKWIKLDNREKIVVKGFAHGKTYDDIFRENTSVFERRRDIIAVMSRALGDLGIDRGDLKRLRFAVASSSESRLLSAQRVLTRIFGKDIPLAPRGWDQKTFERALYDGIFQQLAKAKSDYKDEFRAYLQGLQPKEIAEQKGIVENRKVQRGILTLKALIKRRLARQFGF